mmetsp:Transcript_67775/g.136133  ORF Transcript_67775/g.136133 Transcript_67775/m.136133 type:complete len:109 (+) Transcript_67775:80-406(+)
MAARRPVLALLALALAALVLLRMGLQGQSFVASPARSTPATRSTLAGSQPISRSTELAMSAEPGDRKPREAFDNPLYGLIAAIVVFSPFVLSSFNGIVGQGSISNYGS